MKSNLIRAAVIAASVALPASAFASIGLYGNSAVNVSANVVQVGVQANATSSMKATSTSSHMSATGTAASASGRETAVSAGGVVSLGRGDVNDNGNSGADIQSAASVSSDNDVASFARGILRNDDSVTNVAATSGEVSVSYKEPAKFLGFIPSTVTVTLTTDASGNVQVSHPWYGFLMSKSGDEAALKASAEAKAHAAAQSAVNASASATISSQMKAFLIQALHDALKTQIGAQASTTASVNAH